MRFGDIKNMWRALLVLQDARLKAEQFERELLLLRGLGDRAHDYVRVVSFMENELDLPRKRCLEFVEKCAVAGLKAERAKRRVEMLVSIFKSPGDWDLFGDTRA